MNVNNCDNCKHCKPERSLFTLFGLVDKMTFARCRAAPYSNATYTKTKDGLFYCSTAFGTQHCKWETKEKPKTTWFDKL